MITIRKAEERGGTKRDWLDPRFSFSFADYHDPEHMGFSVLRVLNDDRIAPGKGFGPHAHRDMAIITYVLEGSLLHRDSMGENHVLRPNEVQTMSAGTGIVHSEFNASETDPSHSIQIWIMPAAEDLPPSYQQLSFDPAEKQGRFRLLAAPEASGIRPVTRIHQDARLSVADLRSGEVIKQPLLSGRHAWVQVVRGEILLNGQRLREGDGAGVREEAELSFAGSATAGGEFLFFDLP